MTALDFEVELRHLKQLGTKQNTSVLIKASAMTAPSCDINNQPSRHYVACWQCLTLITGLDCVLPIARSVTTCSETPVRRQKPREIAGYYCTGSSQAP